MLQYVLSITARTHFTHSPINSTWSTAKHPLQPHPDPAVPEVSTGDKPVKDPNSKELQL